MATSAPRWAVWLVVAGATVVVLVLSAAVWLTVALLRADAAHAPPVALEELARDHPVLTLEVAGDVDRDEVAALAAALGEDPELLILARVAGRRDRLAHGRGERDRRLHDRCRR